MGFFVVAILIGMVASLLVSVGRSSVPLLGLIPHQVLLFFVLVPMFTIFALFDVEIVHPMTDEVMSSQSFLEPALIMLVVACLLFGGFFLRALWITSRAKDKGGKHRR